MGNSLERTKSLVNASGKLDRRFKENRTALGRFATRIRLATHGLRGFRMEMLGVMFFGMGMQRFFTGMLRPAMELTGFFEIWKTTLQILFLPIAMKLLEWGIKFLEWVGNLKEETKFMIGKFVIFGAILGVFLFLIGTLALGIGSIILVFGGLFNIIDRLIPDVKFAGVNMSSFIEAGLGIGLVKKGFDLAKKAFGFLKDKLGEIDFVKDLFEEFKETLKMDSQFGKLETLFNDIKRTGEDAWEKIKEKMDEMGVSDFIKSIGDLTDKFSDMLPSLESVAASLGIISQAITDVKNAWNKTIDNIKNNPLEKFLTKQQEKTTKAREERIEKGKSGESIFKKVTGAIGYWVTKASGAKVFRKFNDFIIRPGQAPMSIDPNDTVVGFKGNPPNLSGNGGGANITNIFNGFTMDELSRRIEEASSKNVDDIKRLVGA
jgi:hypothetical protein